MGISIKKRAIQVTLSDKETMVTIHAPTMENFVEYMDSFQVIAKLGEFFKALQSLQGGIFANLSAARIDRAIMEEFYPLLAGLSDITVDEYKALPVDDGMAIILGYIQLLAPEQLVENPTTAETPPQEQPA